jgi:hypothetical protein
MVEDELATEGVMTDDDTAMGRVEDELRDVERDISSSLSCTFP